MKTTHPKRPCRQPVDDPPDDPLVYLPPAEAILAACLEIQATWSDAERDNRRRGIVGGGKFTEAEA